MKISISSQQREHLQNEGYIEFDQLVPLDTIEENIEKVLTQRLGTPYAPSEKVFSAGLDLWRASEGIKKLVFSRSLGDIAYQLFEEKPIRLAFDLYLPFPKEDRFVKLETYKKFLETKSLQEFSCIQGLLGGLIICLGGKYEGSSSFFPKNPGSGIFISPDHPLDFSTFQQGTSYFLITYAQSNSLFIRNPQSPHYPLFLKQGYSVTDKLLDNLNPIIYK